MAAPSRQSVLQLYRTFLRCARDFQDYNYRSYAKRRIKLGFNQQRQASGEALTKSYQDALLQLESLKRQVAVSKLYPPKQKSVMEMGPKGKGPATT